MKILYTVHQFFPEYHTGTESLTLNTAQEMKHRGHEIQILTGHLYDGESDIGHDFFDHYVYEGLPVDRYLYSKNTPHISRNRLKADYDNPVVADFFRKKLENYRPDVVHFYHLQRLSTSLIDICYEYDIPTVFSVTDFWILCPTTQLLLPNHDLCEGPQKDHVNCFKHLLLMSKIMGTGTPLSDSWDRLIAMILRRSRCFSKIKMRPIELLYALTQRPEIIKRQVNRVDKVLVATREMAGVLQKWGVNPLKLCHLPFAVKDMEENKVSKKGYRKELRIGFIGTLLDHKGAHVLIEAVRSLPEELPIVLKIYGNLHQFPDYVNRLYALSNKDQRIRFLGTFIPDQIGEIFFDLDILVVPSLWPENTPLVIYSAQMARVPVIASNVSGVSEIVIDGVNGFLVERNSSKQLASTIKKLCMNRDLVQKLSDASTPPHSFIDYSNNLEKMYKHLMH